MSATVTKEGLKYLAWCEPCQDGLRWSKGAACDWAADHNRERHAA